MSDWVRCNVCCAKPSREKQFLLTNCGHLFCKDCIAESPEKCRKCGNPCKSIILNSQMKPEVEEHFTDLSTLMKKQHSKLLQVYEFQKSHWKHISACHEKQEASLAMIKKQLPHFLEMEREVHILREENSHLRRLLTEGFHGNPGGMKLPSPGASLKRGHVGTPSASPYPTQTFSRSAINTPKQDSGHQHQHWQSQVPRTPAGPARLTVRTPPSNGMIGTPRRTPSPHQARPGSAGNTPGLILRTANTPGPHDATTPSIFKASGTPGHFSPMNLGSPMAMSRSNTPGVIRSIVHTQMHSSQTPSSASGGRLYPRSHSPGGSQYSHPQRSHSPGGSQYSHPQRSHSPSTGSQYISHSQSEDTPSQSSRLDPSRRQIQLPYKPRSGLVGKAPFVTTPGSSQH